MRPGGVVAYSTCSFNPLENEAVVCACLVGARAEADANAAEAHAKIVAEALTKGEAPPPPPAASSEDEFEVIPAFSLCGDGGDAPTGLAAFPGLTRWRVPLLRPDSRSWGPAATATAVGGAVDGGGAGGRGGCGPWCAPLDEHLAAVAAAKAAAASSGTLGVGTSSGTSSGPLGAADAPVQLPAHNPAGAKRSMFPAAGEYARLNGQLANCTRLLPMGARDSGGFFVALVRRRDDAKLRSWERGADHAAAEIGGGGGGGGSVGGGGPVVDSPAKKQKRGGSGGGGGGGGAGAGDCTDCTAEAKSEAKGVVPVAAAVLDELARFYGLPPCLFGLSDGPSSVADATADKPSAEGGESGDGGDRGGRPVLLTEGRRVVLLSRGLAGFLARLQNGRALVGNDGHRGGVGLHGCGLRVFLRLSEGSFRACSTCRWRPCQEGARWLASVASKRVLRLKPRALAHLFLGPSLGLPCLGLLSLDGALSGAEAARPAADHEVGGGAGGGCAVAEAAASAAFTSAGAGALLRGAPSSGRALSATCLAALAAAGHATLDPGLLTPRPSAVGGTSGGEASGGDGGVAGSPHEWSLAAGGLLLGVLQGSDGDTTVGDTSERGTSGGGNTSDGLGWAWVACMCTTTTLHVYADRNSLAAVADALVGHLHQPAAEKATEPAEKAEEAKEIDSSFRAHAPPATDPPVDATCGGDAGVGDARLDGDEDGDEDEDPPDLVL